MLWKTTTTTTTTTTTGAPELREELRDQHSRINAERGGGPEVRLPYHGSGKSSAAAAETAAERAAAVDRATVIRKEREQMAALAAARGTYGSSAEGYGAVAGLRGQADPPDGSEEETEAAGAGAGISAAAMRVAAEERARRFMLASGGAPGLGGHFLSPHLGLAGLGGLGAGSLNPFLAGHSPAAAAQLRAAAALQAASGPPLFSQHALMMASQPSTAALLQASRSRELAHLEAANMAAASGVNPLLLGAHGAAPGSYQDSARLHELMAAGAGAAGKRDREEIEREIDESYAKAAKLSRQYL